MLSFRYYEGPSSYVIVSSDLPILFQISHQRKSSKEKSPQKPKKNSKDEEHATQGKERWQT